jgi:hypothetical protein
MKLILLVVLVVACASVPSDPPKLEKFKWTPELRQQFEAWKKAREYRPQDRIPNSAWKPRYPGWTPSPRLKV